MSWTILGMMPIASVSWRFPCKPKANERHDYEVKWKPVRTSLENIQQFLPPWCVFYQMTSVHMQKLSRCIPPEHLENTKQNMLKQPRFKGSFIVISLYTKVRPHLLQSSGRRRCTLVPVLYLTETLCRTCMVYPGTKRKASEWMTAATPKYLSSSIV